MGLAPEGVAGDGDCWNVTKMSDPIEEGEED